MKKFLIIRFSSIGDIVLTTPVIRSLKKVFPDSQIHFLTKSAYAPLLRHHPDISHLHLLQDDLRANLRALKKENFDHVFDLHQNLRTLRVKLALRRPASSFFKANINKYFMTHSLFRSWASPIDHVVKRYGKTLNAVGASLDDHGLEVYLPDGLEDSIKKEMPAGIRTANDRLAVVLGAKFATKRWPSSHFVELLNKLNRSVLLLGGPDAKEEAAEIASRLTVPYFNAVAAYDLLSSAALMKSCKEVIAHDTGLMHIAAAFQMKIYSLWGNTVPELGMTPYKTDFEVLEITGLKCRPCSKIGYAACPKGHFRCMKELTAERVWGVMK